MRFILILALFPIFYSCSSENGNSSINSNNDPNQWVIPEGDLTGSFNLFPIAQNPVYFKVSEVDIADDALVALISFNDEIRVYPYQFIRLYESINDDLDNNHFAITYCPITHSAICYNTSFEDQKLLLRGSGYLFNNNLIAYDEKSDTYWSQMLTTCIRGKYSEQILSTFNVVETSWATVKGYFNDAQVFTDLSTSNTKSPLKINEKNNFEDGESIFGIINDRYAKEKQIHVFKYEEFENAIILFERKIGTDNMIIIGSKEHHFITSYIAENNTNYNVLQGNFPVIMEDNYGNIWDVFGKAISGPKMGQQLKSPTSFVALGWAWKSFYNNFVFSEI